jgi:transcriptional regulator with XRE-family HTH domain
MLVIPAEQPMPKKPHPLNPTYSPLAMFGSELRVLRTRRDLSLEGLSALVGYSGSFIGMIERAEEMPKRDVVIDLDQALDAGGAVIHLDRLPGILRSSRVLTHFGGS